MYRETRTFYTLGWSKVRRSYAPKWYQDGGPKPDPREVDDRGSDANEYQLIMLAEAAVLRSLVEFFVRENKFRGLLVAIWPPTILAFVSYFNQKKMEERMEPFNRLSAALNRAVGS